MLFSCCQASHLKQSFHLNIVNNSSAQHTCKWKVNTLNALQLEKMQMRGKKSLTEVTTSFTDQNVAVMMHCYIKHVTFTKGQRESENRSRTKTTQILLQQIRWRSVSKYTKTMHLHGFAWRSVCVPAGVLCLLPFSEYSCSTFLHGLSLCLWLCEDGVQWKT